MNKPQDTFWVHLVRTIAIFGVIVIHVAAPIIWADTRAAPMDWWLANTLNAVSRASVPLFFMISGFLLIGRDPSWRVLLRKRLPRIGLPLLFWSTAYLLWMWFYEGSDVSLVAALVLLVAGEVEYHLWFLYKLLEAYLCIPILDAITRGGWPNSTHYFLALWVLGSAVIPMFADRIDRTPQAEFLIANGYFGYLVLGKVMGESTITPRRLAMAAVVFAGCSVVTAVGTHYEVFSLGTSEKRFERYLNLQVLLQSAAAFLLLRALGEARLFVSRSGLRSIVVHLSGTSFGVYLVHVAILDALVDGATGFTIDGLVGDPTLAFFATVAVVYVASHVTTLAVQRIPMIGKRVV